MLAHVAPERLILVSGVVSALIYGGFIVAFPITLWWSHPHAADDPNVINDMGRITQHSFWAATAFVVAILVLFACQFFALVAAGRVHQIKQGAGRRDTLVRWSVLAFPIIFVLVMIWMQPVTTTDLYGYVARGYLFAQLHQNPMILKASILPGGSSGQIGPKRPMDRRGCSLRALSRCWAARTCWRTCLPLRSSPQSARWWRSG